MVDFVWVFEREHEMGFISVRSVDAESDTGLANAAHQTAAAGSDWLLALQHHRQPSTCCIKEERTFAASSSDCPGISAPPPRSQQLRL